MATSLDQIASTLGFTLEELTLNAAGKLSPHQVWVSVRTALVFSLLALLAGGALVAVATVKANLLYRFFAVVVLVGGIFLTGREATRSAMALVSRQVLSAEGPVKIGPGARYNVSVTIGPWHDIVADAGKVLTPGARYRVYYLARSNRLLSIEPLPEPGPADRPLPR